MALKILHSNRVEVLLEHLAASIERPAPGMGALEAETVLLDNPAMGSWINLQLATRHGVAANIRYPRLSEFFWQLARSLLPLDIPELTPLNKQEMTWRLLGVLQDPAVTGQAAMAPVNRYLEPGGCADEHADLKRFQLAARVADLFDQYQVFRPHWFVDAWDRGRPAGRGSRRDHWRAAESWQRVLWRALRDTTGHPTGAPAHRSDIHVRLCEALSGRVPADHLPYRRLFVFGVTAMPGSELDVLMGLARHVDTHLFLFNPCAEHWCDIPGIRQAVREDRARYSGERNAPAGPAPELGNPLLAAQARQVRDFLELVYDRSEAYQLASAVEDAEAFVDPAPDRDSTLLAAVQQDVLELSFRGEIATLERETGEAWPMPAGERRGVPSIHFHSCHGRLREVEVLHDQLLDMFERDPGLNPRDVVVMMPRVGPYVPYIQAVFERGRRADGRRLIEYHVTDRTLVEESPVLDSFATLLDLPDSRMPLSEVLGVLELPAVQRRFGLTREDYETLRGWLIDAGVRWGLDADHREAETGAAYREFSWAFGLDRMFAGYAMAAGDDCRVNGVRPLDDIEGGNAAVFDGLLRFWRQLRRYRDALSRSRRPAEWFALLSGLLNDLYLPDDDDRAAFMELRRGLEVLATADETGWHRDPVTLSVVRAAVQPVLEQAGARRHPWSEGVKFCSLLPMRGVPFEVVYLLGMNMEDYPRRIDRPSFDLMRDDFRPGDRSARVDDRWLFLEALLSARRAFHVSYVGQDQHRNEPREPSVVVSELAGALRDGYRTDAFDDKGDLQPGWLFTRHPLQPFHPAYFSADRQEDDRRLSFDRAACDIALTQAAVRAEGIEAIERDPDARWRRSGEPASRDRKGDRDALVEVDVDDFTRFFAQPAQWFFRHRGISLSRYEDMVTDEEAWADGDGLQTWQWVDGLLQRINRRGPATGVDRAAAKAGAISAFVEDQRAAGRWPLGAAGGRARHSLEAVNVDYLYLLADVSAPRPLRIDHVISAGGSAPSGRVRVTGELERHGDRYLIQSASHASHKGVLDAYIRMALAARAAGADALTQAWVVFRTTIQTLRTEEKLGAGRFPTCFDASFLADHGRHEAFLERLGGLYLAHRRLGLPFHADIGLALPFTPAADRDSLVQEAWFESSFGRRDAMRQSLGDRAYYGAPDTLLAGAFIEVSESITRAVLEWAGLGPPVGEGRDAG